MAGRRPLWEFSLAVYARRGVAEACLVLQDRHDVDVNMLLFCVWWATHGGGRLSAGECDRACDAVGGWQAQVVVPLRAARRALKADLGVAPAAAEDLRQQVKDLELAAERLEQAVLERSLERVGPHDGGPEQQVVEAAGANLCRYLAGASIKRGPAERAALATILAGCFPDATRGAIDAAIA